MLKPDMAWSEIWSARRFERLHKRKGSCSIQLYRPRFWRVARFSPAKNYWSERNNSLLAHRRDACIVCLRQRLDRLMRAERLALPPLIYPAAVYTSWRDFRTNLRPIMLLATVLVLVTMAATAYVFHSLVGLPLAVGFVFGALISPPDAVAALSVTQNLRVPRKIIVILEGESLVNDATSFISFRFAVAAMMTGSFSLGEASLRFLFVAAGGVGVGVAVGWLATQLQKRLDDPPVQTMFSLLTPYVAYFSGESLHVSGILAVVIAGIYYGWRGPRI